MGKKEDQQVTHSTGPVSDKSLVTLAMLSSSSYVYDKYVKER